PPTRESAARCVAPGHLRWLADVAGEMASAVRDGRRRGMLARTARRLPPKRCRIIDIGGPNATPVRRDPGVAVEPLAPHPARSRRQRWQRSAPDRRRPNHIAFAVSHEVPPPAWNT